MYNGGNTEAEIEALNRGEKKYSDYMRPGFEFLQELIDRGYVDAQKAYTSEAIDGEGPDFLAQKTPIVMAYWGAANTETAYGAPDFEMKVIGFPSSRGPMPVVSMTQSQMGQPIPKQMQQRGKRRIQNRPEPLRRGQRVS